MKEINLRDFYPWYMEDVMVEVTEEVAEELLAGQRYIKARRRVYRNKAYCSLDAEDGIEYSACLYSFMYLLHLFFMRPVMVALAA